MSEREELAELREMLEVGGLSVGEERRTIERIAQLENELRIGGEIIVLPRTAPVKAAVPSPVEPVVQDESADEAPETVSRRALWDLLAELNSAEKSSTGEERRRVAGQRDRVFRMLYA